MAYIALLRKRSKLINNKKKVILSKLNNEQNYTNINTFIELSYRFDDSNGFWRPE